MYPHNSPFGWSFYGVCAEWVNLHVQGKLQQDNCCLECAENKQNQIRASSTQKHLISTLMECVFFWFGWMRADWEKFHSSLVSKFQFMFFIFCRCMKHTASNRFLSLNRPTLSLLFSCFWTILFFSHLPPLYSLLRPFTEIWTNHFSFPWYHPLHYRQALRFPFSGI